MRESRREVLWRAPLWAIALLGSAVLLAGCQPQFNRQNYDTIYRGEPAQEVRRKLGPPERSTPECWDYVKRRPSHYEARIWFRDGLVTRKEWFNRKELFKDGE